MKRTTKEKAQPPIETNPYYSKYAAKIEDKLKEKNATLSSIPKKEDIIEVSPEGNVRESHHETRVGETSSNRSGSDKVIKPRRSRSCDPPTSRLDKIVKLSSFKTRTEHEIKELWNEYHRNKDGVFGCIEAAKWKVIRENSRKYPLSLYAVPRNKPSVTSDLQLESKTHVSGGFEFFVGQFRGLDCFFTPLVTYKTHGEYAPVCMNICHYDELIEDKSIVLMKGEVDIHVLNVIEAQCLVNQIYLNYSKEDNSLLKSLNTNPGQVDHQQIVDALISEAITLSPNPTTTSTQETAQSSNDNKK